MFSFWQADFVISIFFLSPLPLRGKHTQHARDKDICFAVVNNIHEIMTLFKHGKAIKNWIMFVPSENFARARSVCGWVYAKSIDG
jgi:hypothetical protein